MNSPEQIGPYRVLAVVAQEGITESYRVEAVACPGPIRILKTFPLAEYADPESRERFRREVIIAMAIHHARVWEVVDYGFWGDIPYIVMEDLGGRSLADEMRARGPCDLVRWHAVMGQILDGLEAVHRTGAVHRGLQPDRILVTPDGSIRVGSFGLSTRPDLPRLTVSGASVGSLLYSAPEQMFNAHHVDHRADMFSVGVIGYELLTGHLPVETDNLGERCSRLAVADLDPLGRSRPDLSTEVGDWLAKMTAREPDDRFPNVYAAMMALHRLLRPASER